MARYSPRRLSFSFRGAGEAATTRPDRSSALKRPVFDFLALSRNRWTSFLFFLGIVGFLGRIILSHHVLDELVRKSRRRGGGRRFAREAFYRFCNDQDDAFAPWVASWITSAL